MNFFGKKYAQFQLIFDFDYKSNKDILYTPIPLNC